MKIEFHYNEQFAYFVFVAFLTGILCLISGVSWLSAFLTGVLIYLFLRFTYFLWNMLHRMILHLRGGHPDA